MRAFILPVLASMLIAAAPAPAAAPNSGAPLLTLDYTFSFTPAGFAPSVVNGESGVANYGGASTTSSTGSYMSATSGMLHVEVLGHASDGGITIKMLDQIAGPPQNHGPVHELTCEIYSGGNASCTQPPYGASYDEDVLLPLLTPTFFALDGKGLTKTYFIEQTASTMMKTERDVTLTSSPDKDANKTDYNMSATTLLRGASYRDITGKATGSIVVDQTIHLPVAVDYSWQNTGATGDAADQYRVQLNLKSVQ